MEARSNHEIINNLQIECALQIEQGPDVVKDPYIAKFAKSFAGWLARHPEESTEMATRIAQKQERMPYTDRDAFNQWLRLVQMRLMDCVDYPFKKQATWDVAVHKILNNDQERHSMALMSYMFNVGSDVETRVAGPKLVMQLLQPERTGNPEDAYKIVNVGSARDHSLAMLVGNQLRFPEVQIEDNGKQLWRREKDDVLQKNINSFLMRDVAIGDSYGIDLWPLKDRDWSNFLKACRFYPSELLDVRKRNRYDLLELNRDLSTNLHHIDADFSDMEELYTSSNGKLTELQPDMVSFLTCLYQNYPEKRKVMFDNARTLLMHGDVQKRLGLIVVQDFLSNVHSPENANHPMEQLEFSGTTGKPFTYRTVVYDPNSPDEGFREFASWNNGRCEVIRPSDLMLNAIRLKTKTI